MDNTTPPTCQEVIQAGKSSSRPQDEQEKLFLLENAQIGLWDSLESDTESLVQERRYQKELENRIRQADEKVSVNYERDAMDMGESSGDEEDDDENDSEEREDEDEYLYDSLDVAAPQQRQINAAPPDAEVGQIQTQNTDQWVLPEKRHDMSGCGSEEDEYAALRYDPNWRTNLKVDQLFEKGKQLLLEGEVPDIYADPDAESLRTAREHSKSAERKDRSAPRQAPAADFAGGVAPDRQKGSKSKLPEAPDRPPPQGGPAVGAGPGQSDSHRPRQMPPGTERAASNRTPKTVPAAWNRRLSGENQAAPDNQEESYEEMNRRYSKEHQVSELESAPAHEASNCNDANVHRSLNRSHRLWSVKQNKPKADIVERNKTTLGVRVKQASYLSAHAQKAVNNDRNNKPEPEAVEEIIELKCLDPELRWQQKTQKLKVHREKSKGKKGGTLRKTGVPVAQASAGSNQNKELNPSVPQDGRAARVNARRQQPEHPEVHVMDEVDLRDDVPLPLPLPAPQWQPEGPPYMINPPTLNLNINLNASGDMAPFLGQEHQHNSLKLSPNHGPAQWTRPAVSHHAPPCAPHDLSQVPHYGPGYPSTGPQALVSNWSSAGPTRGRPSPQQGSQRRPREVPPLWDHDSHSLRGLDSDRIWMAPTKGQSAGEGGRHCSPGDQHVELWLQHRHPVQSPGSCTVLPPIGETMSSDSELNSQNTEQKMRSIHRSNSDGYLAQLERRKQLKEKTTYKEYTLKDYKALRQDVKLGGLGPNYNVSQITAEKIRRRRQYSDEVREHNKNVGRIPFLPARNLGSGDAAESAVPRRKALEYARNIPKPKPPSVPKSSERDRTRDLLCERGQLMEHLDQSQLARLEMLQKRHEEEKQLVAHFKALRAL
ncbi:hypothetical protein GJAV_G00138550 [Gymnothorax javanicus]|nr:hypothetical protein GJAV_G00138550 [Gymnothorax javanicus]